MNKHLSNSILLLLRPLIGLMNQNGIAFGDFSRLVKQAYIQETERELVQLGEKPTTSKIAIITGLTRKDVSALRKEGFPKLEASMQKNRAVRVLSGWISDLEFCDSEGRANILPLLGKQNSFESLVSRYSGDMPYKSMQQELERIKSIRITENNEVELIRGAYIPSGEEESKYQILGEDVALLVSTIKHNILDVDAPPFYQRKVSYDSVPAKYIDDFRKIANKGSQQLLVKLNKWLAQHDTDREPKVEADKPMKVGVGLYYFEEEANDSATQGTNKDE